ncbi:TIGR03915 family putative DNA repair protein [Paenibacillus daejeonensis]|uniref:TIGR03915 family putative DNA repair protein n=1 Tax=Paenibacillus daejeonensis TaxID=135193 RepID=UPI00035C27F5|nr:TIGR03915 family putative DNA repair protein [Paenibacillus daejeonensis]
MTRTTSLAYQYDGTFDGWLCCVFESYLWKEMPIAIHSAEDPQGLLLEAKWIETDPEKAARVRRSMPEKMGPEATEWIRLGFLTCVADKELLLLRFLRLGYTHGPTVMDRLADDTVHALGKAIQQLRRESHDYLAFLRFSVYGSVMAAIIEPRNEVLSQIAEHFCERYRNETFLIYDQTHRQAIVHRPGRYEIIPLDEWAPPEPDEAEEKYRRLWKGFYNAVGIRERRNHKLRASHMPKRYWRLLPEMQVGWRAGAHQGNASHEYAADLKLRSVKPRSRLRSTPGPEQY